MDKKFIEELYSHTDSLQTKEEFNRGKEWFLELNEEQLDNIVNWHLLPIEERKELFPHHIRNFSRNYYDVLIVIPEHFALHPEKEMYKYIAKLLGKPNIHEVAMECLAALQDLRAVPLMKKYLESEDKEIVKSTIADICDLFCLESIEVLEEAKAKWEKDQEITNLLEDRIGKVKRGMELVSQFPSYMDWLKDEFKEENMTFGENSINTHGAFIFYVDEE